MKIINIAILAILLGFNIGHVIDQSDCDDICHLIRKLDNE